MSNNLIELNLNVILQTERNLFLNLKVILKRNGLLELERISK